MNITNLGKKADDVRGRRVIRGGGVRVEAMAEVSLRRWRRVAQEDCDGVSHHHHELHCYLHNLYA